MAWSSHHVIGLLKILVKEKQTLKCNPAQAWQSVAYQLKVGWMLNNFISLVNVLSKCAYQLKVGLSNNFITIRIILI